MIAADRRSILQSALAALLLPAMSAFPARAATNGKRFNPPSGPMRYCRRLDRGLSGGASFIVDRDFAIRFVAETGGYLIDGEQLSVEVDAPEQLAAFARIEREKVEHALFPLKLDEEGQIAVRPSGNDQQQLEKSVAEAMARLKSLPYSAAELSEMEAFVQAVRLTAAQLVSELPADLFAPTQTKRVAHRELALPNGGAGSVTTTFTAEIDLTNGLMREATREVVTDISGDKRHTLESWRLAPLA